MAGLVRGSFLPKTARLVAACKMPPLMDAGAYLDDICRRANKRLLAMVEIGPGTKPLEESTMV